MVNEKVGIIGGIGPESSIEYYRLIIKRFQDRLGTRDYPEMLIHSIDMTEMLDYVFDRLAERTVIPLISIVEETCKEINHKKYNE